MRLYLLALLPIAAAAQLSKRCSPVRDPDLPRGYYPPAPCWQSFNTACQPFIASGTQMTLDASQKTAIVYGVNDYCAAEIAEELAREKDGRKNYGWIRTHGNLTFIPRKTGGSGGGILVISDMEDAAVQRYSKLTYQTGA